MLPLISPPVSTAATDHAIVGVVRFTADLGVESIYYVVA